MNIYKSEVFQGRTLVAEATHWMHKHGTAERESISAYASKSSLLIVEWSASATGEDVPADSWEATSFKTELLFSKADLAKSVSKRVPGEHWEHESWRIEFLEGLSDRLPD